MKSIFIKKKHGSLLHFMRCCCLLLIGIQTSSLLFAQQANPDIIVKTDGSTILAKVSRIGDSIEYKKWENLDGPTYYIHKTDVSHINYGDGRKDTFQGMAGVSSPSTGVVPEGYHRVGRGETLGRIASLYNISEKSLLEANPNISNVIYDGMLISIPSAQKEEPTYKSGGWLSVGAGWSLLPKETRENFDTNWFFNLGLGYDARFGDFPVFLTLPAFDFSWARSKLKGADEPEKTFIYTWPVQIGVGTFWGNFRIGGLIGGAKSLSVKDAKSVFVSGLRFNLNLGVDTCFQLLWVGENSKPTKMLSFSFRF